MPTEVVKPALSIAIPGGGSPDGVTINLTVNAVSSATVTFHRDPSKVVKPLNAAAIAEMRSAQQSRFQLQTEPNAVVSASDGRGGTLVMRGFVAAPRIRQTKSSNMISATIIGVDALLDSLKLGIYGSLPGGARSENSPALDYVRTPVKTNGDIPKMLQEITDTLVGNFDVAQSRIKGATLKELNTINARINDTVSLKTWQDILSNSDVKYPEWTAALTNFPLIEQSLVERAKELMQQGAESFWQVVHALMAEFQMYYVPSLDGAGKLLRADSRLNGPPLSYELGNVTYEATDGAPRLLPLTGVALFGPAMPDQRLEAGQEDIRGSIVGQWPAEFALGYIKETTPPAWLTVGGGYLPFTAPKAPAGGEVSLDPAAYASGRQKIDEALTSSDNEIGGKMLTAYARNIYTDLMYADSTATLTLPLDFTLQHGRRYNFRTGDGGTFSGFVHTLSHFMQINNGQENNNATTVYLSHITY